MLLGHLGRANHSQILARMTGPSLLAQDEKTVPTREIKPSRGIFACLPCHGLHEVILPDSLTIWHG